MGSILVIGLAVILFILAFFSKRRFGVLGLALCAGAVLSTAWAPDLAIILENNGVPADIVPLQAVAAVALTLLPPVLLLFSGPKYSSGAWRITGALLFASLAVVFLLDPLGDSLVLGQTGETVFEIVGRYVNIIVGAGVAIALMDMLSVRGKKMAEHHKK